MPQNDQPLHSSRLELESLKLEYSNQFDRSNKLDNKVYITITFFGFFFVFITGLLNGIKDLRVPQNTLQLILVSLYIISCAAVMIFYIYLLIYFMRLLKPEHILRMDPYLMEREQLSSVSEDEACQKLIHLYRLTINENLYKLKVRCDDFTNGLHFVVPTVILAFSAYIFEILLQVMA